MFCRALSPVRLPGSILALCAAAMLVSSAPDRADAGKFGRTFQSGGGGSMPSSTPKHHGAESVSPAKHQDGDGASSGKHETSDEASGGGLSLRPSLEMKSEDQPESKPETKSSAAIAPAPASSGTGKNKVARLKEPHPLAAPHKGMDVTVCEAGCTNEKQQIVYVQPTTASKEVATSEMKPNSSSGAAAASKDAIICMGGCYDTPKSYASSLASAAPTAQIESSVKPTSARSGDWMRRIDKSRGDKPKKK